MSAPSHATIKTLLSARIAYPALVDSDVPGREGSTPAQIATYDGADLGFRVLVSSNGHRYTKTSLTKYADGGRITQEDAGGGAEGIDTTYLCSLAETVGKTVYLSSANTVSLASANDLTTAPALGIVVSKPTPTTCVVRSYGPVTLAGLTPGVTYYLDTASGLVTDAAPTGVSDVVQPLGVATSATTLFLQVTRRTNRGSSGSPTSPTYGFSASPGAGMFLAGSETVGIAAGGALVAQVSTSGLGVLVSSASTAVSANAIKLTRLTTGAPANGIGVSIEMIAQATIGTLTAARIVGAFSNVTGGNETGVVDLLPAFAGSLASAGLRVDGHNGANGAMDCGANVLPVASAHALDTGVAVVPYSSNPATHNISLTVGGVGTGSLKIPSAIELASGSPRMFASATNAGLDIVPNGFGAINVRNAADDATVFGVQSVLSGNAGLVARSLIDTSGANPVTMNTPVGRFRILSGASQVTVNNDLIVAGSHIWPSIRTVTNNPVSVADITATDGAFTLHLSGDPGASNCDIDFLVINPSV